MSGRHGAERNRLPVNGRALATTAKAVAPAMMARAKQSVRAALPDGLAPPTMPGGIEPPPSRRSVGIDYDTDWARTYPARLARVVLLEGMVRPGVTALARPTVRGLDRLDDLDGPAIFAANHHSHLDTPLLGTTIPDPWRHRLVIGAAADYFFGNRLTAPLSALVVGAIPIERQKVSRRSADEAAALIDDGWSFLIFPEGGRSPDGWGQPFRGGAAYLSLRCEVPVVPIHIEGTGRILRKGRSLPKPSPTTITFGTPLHPRTDEDSRRFASRLEREVAALADESRTDWYEARRRAHAGATPPLQGPEVGAWRRTWDLGDRSPRRKRRARWPEL
ncbi:MAG: 1-acyl-sn-glycerol-3-phosphate acyltransferase [Acidimicrobiia bacterium]|nr:1-acyl-sn-glycerol-3-phosphate acyltransferase [Acidimicrobiia bacterium]